MTAEDRSGNSSFLGACFGFFRDCFGFVLGSSRAGAVVGPARENDNQFDSAAPSNAVLAASVSQADLVHGKLTDRQADTLKEKYKLLEEQYTSEFVIQQRIKQHEALNQALSSLQKAHTNPVFAKSFKLQASRAYDQTVEDVIANTSDDSCYHTDKHANEVPDDAKKLGISLFPKIYGSNPVLPKDYDDRTPEQHTFAFNRRILRLGAYAHDVYQQLGKFKNEAASAEYAYKTFYHCLENMGCPRSRLNSSKAMRLFFDEMIIPGTWMVGREMRPFHLVVNEEEKKQYPNAKPAYQENMHHTFVAQALVSFVDVNRSAIHEVLVDSQSTTETFYEVFGGDSENEQNQTVLSQFFDYVADQDSDNEINIQDPLTQAGFMMRLGQSFRMRAELNNMPFISEKFDPDQLKSYIDVLVDTRIANADNDCFAGKEDLLDVIFDSFIKNIGGEIYFAKCQDANMQKHLDRFVDLGANKEYLKNVIDVSAWSNHVKALEHLRDFLKNLGDDEDSVKIKRSFIKEALWCAGNQAGAQGQRKGLALSSSEAIQAALHLASPGVACSHDRRRSLSKRRSSILCGNSHINDDSSCGEGSDVEADDAAVIEDALKLAQATEAESSDEDFGCSYDGSGGSKGRLP